MGDDSGTTQAVRGAVPSHTPWRGPKVSAALLAMALVALSACTASDEPQSPAPSAHKQIAAHKRIEVLGTHPHDPSLFTQGLEIHGDTVYEATGEYGESKVFTRTLDGQQPKASADLSRDQFGEGLTLAPDTTVVTPTNGSNFKPKDDVLWQLTWKDERAYARDPETLKVRATAEYRGQGWGLCHQGRDSGGPRLVMSNGSDELTFRDPNSFEETGSVKVTRDGEPVRRLNELECVGDTVYANVFTTDEIVEIDLATGAVRASIDASEAADSLPEGVTDDPDAVLNGIAAVPGTDRFWITGKLWPTIYEVRFVE